MGQNAMLKHYVGVYDPETNELKLMDSKRVAINGTVREKDLTPDPQDQPVSQRSSQFHNRSNTNLQSHWAMRQELGQQFGTKKAKKAIASLAENAISRGPKGSGTLDAAALALLETMEETTKDMSTREQLAEAAAAAKPRPQANKDAQDIKDVYTLDSLIGTETLKLITVSDWLEAVTKKEEIRTKSRFVANRLQKVGTAQQGVPNSEQIRIEKLKMLRYLLFLIEFHNLLRFDHGKASLPKREALRDLAGLPNAIIDAVKRKFCPSGSFMSRFQVDLLLTHMCALACVIDNFEVDTWDLKEDLNMDMKEMSKYFREIGAKITPFGEVKRKELKLEKAVAAQRRVAKLKLPLDFPRLPFTRKR